ncbi:MAG: carboxypeptidase-like regulatory domain-containing protein [Flammeovirgaceae bacterium]|nr:carboxypeptidase-like regulatory domain-containing protein [Flammeovirgaceae bacterium]
MIFKNLSLFIALQLLAFVSLGQTLYRGIVVDSTTISSLTGVHIKKKNSTDLVTTNNAGIFTISARPTDTLIFSYVSYKPLELPLLFEETILFIRLNENVKILNEVTIKATSLQPSSVSRSPRAMPRPMAASGAVYSPFEYFSKRQKEKRKLLKLIQENDKTITYLQVVMDEEIRESLINEFDLTEAQYYDLLAKFNQQSASLQYSKDPGVIIDRLKDFLKMTTKR